MDRQQLATSKLDAFAALADQIGAGNLWKKLTTLVDEAPLEFMLQQLAKLEPVDRILELKALEIKQESLGAGFCGMLPQQIGDELPVPSDETRFFESAIVLAKSRQANLEAATGAFATTNSTSQGKRCRADQQILSHPIGLWKSMSHHLTYCWMH